MAFNIRKPYDDPNATLDQAFLDRCAGELTNRLEMVCEIAINTDNIFVTEIQYLSDRNKYVGSRFYRARAKFPVIDRTAGDWLDNSVEFSSLEIQINNADGYFNDLLPGGSRYSGSWIGNKVTIKLGVSDIESTYRTIYEGEITDVNGFKRDVSNIVVVCRDKFDILKKNFPTVTFSDSIYPHIENDVKGKIIPFIMGNWEINTQKGAPAVPAFVVNGADPNVFQDGGARNPVQAIISSNPISISGNPRLRRGDIFYEIPSGQWALLGTTGITVNQNTWNVGSEPYLFSSGDEFFVFCSTNLIGVNEHNPIAQAQYILENFGTLFPTDFSNVWPTAILATSAMNIRTRIWLQEPQPIIEYVRSLCNQSRYEVFENDSLEISLSSTWFDDIADKYFNDPEYPSGFLLRNADIERGSFTLEVDDRNNFNTARVLYNFDPSVGEETNASRFRQNIAAKVSVGNRTISKDIVLPNIYEDSTAVSILDEILKIASGYMEYIQLSATWRTLLLDVGDFVRCDVRIGSTVFSDVPMMVRQAGFDPEGIKRPLRLWSFQMIPFPGYTPGYPGTVGGYNATITDA